MNKIPIALVDCNSFYCSCERLFQPHLKNTPIGVLSNNDGCFVSLTSELKSLGIRIVDPYFKVKNLCEKSRAAVFSANFALYTNLSNRVMLTLSKFSPQLEIYSVDEAFLNLSGFEHLKLKDYGHKIKATVEHNVGIPVSIGIAPTKTLAKAANYISKKDKKFGGVLSIMDERDQSLILDRLEVENIWGIGSKSSYKLKIIGIKTAKQFRDFPNEKLIQKLLSKMGRMVQDELRGIPCFNLISVQKKKKEIISSRSFYSPVFDLQELQKAVANYTTVASEKLRRQGSTCSSIEVWIRTSPFKEGAYYSAADSHLFTTQTVDTRKLIKYAWEILGKIYREGHEYKKALVKISGIQDEHEAQLSLLEQGDDQQTQRLMKIIDQINQKEGCLAIKFAACGVSRKNKNHSASTPILKSQRFVTGWTELPVVRCV